MIRRKILANNVRSFLGSFTRSAIGRVNFVRCDAKSSLSLIFAGLFVLRVKSLSH